MNPSPPTLERSEDEQTIPWDDDVARSLCLWLREHMSIIDYVVDAQSATKRQDGLAVIRANVHSLHDNNEVAIALCWATVDGKVFHKLQIGVTAKLC